MAHNNNYLCIIIALNSIRAMNILFLIYVFVISVIKKLEKKINNVLILINKLFVKSVNIKITLNKINRNRTIHLIIV
jgi:hypothetical protein